ncbi:hypothetical protein F154LOC_14560 [Lelliottia sp. F154]|uniref:DUF2931 family protein n=1 Tax=unclassified Lelliottia TaxID=2642424 RepID=UPI000C7E93DB|nr:MULTISPECIES: DUF2931 family protein [unclassified Lelliottia]PLY44700.1 hypothetical protein F159LOC_13720 [Lelliottia sp. F159]PLY49718.1 hypothetical protein F154LOC_14560 [Lelliottia sp. F154]
MKLGKRFFLSLLLAVAGCHSAGSITPEETGEMPYGLWEFAFFTPKALPALVTYVGIIDDKNILYSFRTLDSTQDSWVTVGTWSNKVRRHAQFNKARHPPVAMLFCWDSTIDKKTYETRIIFPESLRSRMSVSTGVDRYGEKAWYDTLLFGLAPGGKVKVWLQNTVGGNGTIPVEPKKITTLSGDKLDGCKGITKHSKGYRYSKTTQEFIKGKTYPYGNW